MFVGMFAFLAAAAAAATLNLTYVDTGKTFTLPPQTTVVVTLIETGSDGGYSWARIPGATNGKVLQFVSRRIVPPPRNKPPGTAGKVIFTYRTIAAGTAQIGLKLYRSFDPPKTPPARIFKATIHVS
ncbi:MAG: Chagasin family peptidase inhibitor [Gaiellaceae bacterium]|jgi:predicted secreted protein|nr:Chagasin family peptidase inhibitor [Gaiellaceae bacterium]